MTSSMREPTAPGAISSGQHPVDRYERRADPAGPDGTRSDRPGRPAAGQRMSLTVLVLIFIGFVSLGLPDGLLGVAWPSIRQTFGLPLDALERNVTTNVLSAHWLIHALLPLLELGHEPRIINVSSGAGKLDALKAEPNMPAYRLSKLLLNGLTISYAGDLKGKVAVNSLDPGWLKTDLGGPNAPGEPADGAVRMLELATKPFSVTGGFWYGAEPIDF